MRDGRHVTTRSIDEVDVPELVRLMANRNLSEHFPKVRVERGAELLRAEGLSVRGVLSDISFSLYAGEVLGISGLLGAGRTELARVMAGADRFDQGRLFVDGRETRFRGPADAIARGIGLLPEDRKAHGLVPVSLSRATSPPAWGAAPPARSPSRGCEADLAAPISSELRVKRHTREPCGCWSATSRRSCSASGSRDPDIFIFDEPTRGVGVGASGDLRPDESPDRAAPASS